MCKEKEAVAAAAAAYNIYVVDIYVDSCQPTYLPAQEPRLTSMDVTIYDRLCGPAVATTLRWLLQKPHELRSRSRRTRDATRSRPVLLRCRQCIALKLCAIRIVLKLNIVEFVLLLLLLLLL